MSKSSAPQPAKGRLRPLSSSDSSGNNSENEFLFISDVSTGGNMGYVRGGAERRGYYGDTDIQLLARSHAEKYPWSPQQSLKDNYLLPKILFPTHGDLLRQWNQVIHLELTKWVSISPIASTFVNHLGFYNIGYEEETATPTVIVGVKKNPGPSDEQCNAMMRSIRSCLDEHKFEDVPCEIALWETF